MHVVSAGYDKYSGGNFYKIVVDLPELHLESPIIPTAEYGHELIDKIEKLK